MPRNPVLPATRVFDQLYYLGLDWVSATSDGIILIDTLDSASNAQKYIVVSDGQNSRLAGPPYTHT
jgi:hypothetical protein